MFCEFCGGKNYEEARFCEHCGRELKDTINDAQTNYIPYGGRGTQTTEKPIEYTSNYTYQSEVGAKKPISLKTKMILGLTGVLVILFGILYFVGDSITKPERIANDFFKAGMVGDWGKMYSLLDVKDDEFTSKSSFEKLMNSVNTNQLKNEIINYKVKDNNSTSSKKDKELTKQITISYTAKGLSGEKTDQIELIRAKGKKWLMFDNWKVVANELTAKTYTINAPKGAKLFLDDVEIQQKYLSSKMENSYDTYSILNIFVGTHKIKVITPYAKDFEKEMTISDGGSYNINTLEPKEEEKNKIEEITKAFLRDMYDNAMQNKDFTEIKNKFTRNTNDISRIESIYTSLKSSLNSTSSYSTKLLKIDFTDISMSNLAIKEGKLSATLAYKYTYKVSTTNWYTNEVSEFEKTDPLTVTNSLTFVYDNGNWLISSVYNYLPAYFYAN